MSVLLETSEGDVVIDLLTEERPRSCMNFLKLCKMKMYNYCLFHDIQQNFIIQTGDTDEKGGFSIYKCLYGEQAKYFEREVVPKIKHNEKYLVSMVNNGKGFHGSQFLITCCDSADVLDGLHTVFGKVVEGDDVIDRINEAYVDEENRPYQDIRIHHTIVLHDPFDDPPQLPPPPSRSPSPPPHVLSSDRLAVGERTNLLEGLTTEEMVEYIEDKEMKANTQMLEIIGDLPHADVKPPENVLFVCKLNPVTNSDDLEIIFSRFGSILSCEVIRDWKSGDSLCYAFIEFEEVSDCEAAYFKMDNVLIDERRIHVDFSQSVSKLYWSRNTKHQGRYEDDRGDADKNRKRLHDKSDRTQNFNNKRAERVYGKHDERDSRDRDRGHNREQDRNYDRDRDRGHNRERDRGYDRERDRKTDRHKDTRRERDRIDRDSNRSVDRKERKDRREDDHKPEFREISSRKREEKYRDKDNIRREKSDQKKHDIHDQKKLRKEHRESDKSYSNRKSKLEEKILNLEHKIKKHKDKKKKKAS